MVDRLLPDWTWPATPTLGLGANDFHTAFPRELTVETPQSSLSVAAPPPLPSRREVEGFFQSYRAAAQFRTDNNASLDPAGGMTDTGYTAYGEVRLMMQKPQCSTIGVGADLKMFTEHPRITAKGRHLGHLRDDEAHLYISYGQQGACVQPVVDWVRQFVPSVTAFSYDLKFGAVGSGNEGGEAAQTLVHELMNTGGTASHHSLADQYPNNRRRRISPYAAASAMMSSRIGDSPLFWDIGGLLQVAPAATSRIGASFQLRAMSELGLYALVGISGNEQTSALSRFNGAPQNGPFAALTAGVGIQGENAAIDLRLMQNPEGTGLGFWGALSDPKNLAMALTVFVTTDFFKDVYKKANELMSF